MTKLENKIGNSLKSNPLNPNEKTKLVVSLIRKESESYQKKLKQSLKLISVLAQENDLKIHDRLVTTNTYLLLLDATPDFVEQLLKIDVVNEIDRPPTISF